jgi:hypothetical protein
VLAEAQRAEVEELPKFISEILKKTGSMNLTTISLEALEDSQELKIEQRRLKRIQGYIARYDGKFTTKGKRPVSINIETKEIEVRLIITFN